jgi:hypothetical protein
VKYAGFATRIDNDGEGGILVLLALLGVKRNIARNPEMAAGGLTVQIAMHACPGHPDKLTYFVGMEKIVAREDGHGIPRRIRVVFALLLRTARETTITCASPPTRPSISAGKSRSKSLFSQS